MLVFYINISGFIGSGKFLYETWVLDSSYLRYNNNNNNNNNRCTYNAHIVK